jgi:putative intracellular protease/amidase
MQIAVLLFDRFRAVDAVVPHERLSRIPSAQVTFVAERVGPVASDTGQLVLQADAELAELPRPDIIVVPGGAGYARYLTNGTLHRWLRAAALTATWTVGIGEGAQILSAAGVGGSAPLERVLRSVHGPDFTPADDSSADIPHPTPKGPTS